MPARLIGISNIIGGAGINVVQAGSSTLQLSGANTYSGVTVDRGRHRAGHQRQRARHRHGAHGRRHVAGTYGDLTIANNFLVNSAGGSTIDVNAIELTLSGVITDIAALPVLNVISSGGPGTLVLTNANVIAGTLNVTGATVRATTAGSVGNATVALDNATFQVAAADLVFNNNFTLNAGGGTIDANGFVGAGFSLAIAGDISGAGALQITDSTNTAGTVVLLSGINNTYTGGTTVTNTTLQVTNNNSVGTGTVTLDNAVFQPDGLGGNLTFNNNFKINNSAAGSAIDANGVTLTIAGNITDGVGAGKLTVLDSSAAATAPSSCSAPTPIPAARTSAIAATLQLGDATHKASIVGDVFNVGQARHRQRRYVRSSPRSPTTADFGFSASPPSWAATPRHHGDHQPALWLHGLSARPAAPAAPVSRISPAAYDVRSGRFTEHQHGRQRDHSEQSNGGADRFLRQAPCRHPRPSSTRTSARRRSARLFGTDTATAGNATIINNNLGMTEFNAFSTAANATIITNNGGATGFFDNSTAGNAKIVTNDGGDDQFLRQCQRRHRAVHHQRHRLCRLRRQRRPEQ